MGFPRYSAIFRLTRKATWCNRVEDEVTYRRLLYFVQYSTQSDAKRSILENDLRYSPSLNPKNEPFMQSTSAVQYSNTSQGTASETTHDFKSKNNNEIKNSMLNPLNQPLDFDEIFLEHTKPAHPLDECTEDVSHIAPYLAPTFNFAAYADKSTTLQELIKLGVDLHKLDDKPMVQRFLLRLDFEKDMKPYIQFLHDCGVSADTIGKFLTINPMIFKEDMDNLHTRIRYLRAHNFNLSNVQRIVSTNPFWLMFNTKRMDTRLAFFQTQFSLTGPEVRTLTVRAPKLITFNLSNVKEAEFGIREEMGFNKDETKSIILMKPRLLMMSRERTVASFEYVHNVMGISHQILSQQPHILLCRKTRIEMRHKFLANLRRAQYDPEKPLYVSPKALVTGTDAEFCQDVAQVPVELFNTFQKTL
ncbi:transcription termination factor 3, mitochondrial [Cephus cinctus]|uniref:Transcription termination factor 3, mitochondrial n=1 Tax=Cephus cinctus TaxID=211228 RepID=A0AAJ7C3G1_CEPCN|nr:transcription termination factor 3, mitochondrial [Cephus cinctus]